MEWQHRSRHIGTGCHLNGTMGISATGGAVIGIDGNTIARNADFDVAQSGTGVIRTFGNNALTGSGPG